MNNQKVKPLDYDEFEQKILVLLCCDFTYEEIASRLELSKEELFSCIKELMNKNGFKSPYSLIVNFIREGH